eukprot:730712-Pyramimonas_sp.AAC.1
MPAAFNALPPKALDPNGERQRVLAARRARREEALSLELRGGFAHVDELMEEGEADDTHVPP